MKIQIAITLPAERMVTLNRSKVTTDVGVSMLGISATGKTL
jgi:hypothetical protein